MLMIRRPPIPTSTDTLCPSTTRFRSGRLLQYSHRPPPQPHPSSSCLSRGSILPRHRQRQSYWWKDEGTPFGVRGGCSQKNKASRSEEHTSELQSLMRNSYAVF